MSVVTEMRAFNLNEYERVVLPAYRTARGGDGAPLAALLEKVERRLPQSRERDGELLDARLEKAVAEEREAAKAGDARRAADAAWRHYSIIHEFDIGIITQQQVAGVLARLRAGGGAGYLSAVEDARTALVELLCVPHTTRLDQPVDVTSTGLERFLSQRSAAFRDLFSGKLRSGVLEISGWEGGGWIAREEVGRLLVELRRTGKASGADVEDVDLAERVRVWMEEVLEAIYRDESLVLAIGQFM